MTHVVLSPGRRSGDRPAAPVRYGTGRGGRHPLVAVAMVLPLALTLAVLFGGVEAVVTQASSVAGALGR
jgi:hypothetical protein